MDNQKIYTARCRSPLGVILLTASENALTGLCFEGPTPPSATGPVRDLELSESDGCALPLFEKVMAYLDAYFAGNAPSREKIPLAPSGSPFQMRVWRRLLRIPYGETVSYGQIAREIAEEDRRAMSAQAVGGAVGRNPIGILIPCHRVVGKNGDLTGFASGLDRKTYLLRLEGACIKDRRII